MKTESIHSNGKRKHVKRTEPYPLVIKRGGPCGVQFWAKGHHEHERFAMDCTFIADEGISGNVRHTWFRYYGMETVGKTEVREVPKGTRISFPVTVLEMVEPKPSLVGTLMASEKVAEFQPVYDEIAEPKPGLLRRWLGRLGL